MAQVRAVFVSLVVAPALLVGCGSSGGSGGGVSQSKLEAKIKSEPSIQTLLKQGGGKASVTSQLVACIATALKKDADQADLKKYVDGKVSIDSVAAKSKGAKSQAAADTRTCITQVMSKASSASSAAPS
jgi:hypothetical protein